MAAEATPPEGQEPTTPANEPTPGQEPTGDKPKVFDEQYVKELRAENAAARKARQELEARLTEFEERDKSELEKAQGKVSKAERERDEARSALLRYQVAQEKKIDPELVPLLTATSREDLETQADLILTKATPKPADPDFDGGPRDPAPTTKTPEQEHNEFVTALLGVGPATVGLQRPQ